MSLEKVNILWFQKKGAQMFLTVCRNASLCPISVKLTGLI